VTVVRHPGLPFLQAVSPAFFAPVMGIAGLGISWRIAVGVLGVPAPIGETLVWIAFAVFAVMAVLFCVKIIQQPGGLLDDLRDSRKLVFFPLIPTSLLLLSIGIRPYDVNYATYLWIAAAPFNLYFAVLLTGRWLFEVHGKSDLSPAWLFPIVGNGVVPIAGVPLGIVEPSWMFFTIGFVLWIVVFAGLFQRLVFEELMPGKLMPSILILLSPPATFFIAYFELTDGVIDPLSYAMFYTSLFLFVVLLVHAEKLVAVPVSITIWSLTFPMAALTIASLLFSKAMVWVGFYWLAAFLLGVTTFSVSFVVVVSVLALGRYFSTAPSTGG